MTPKYLYELADIADPQQLWKLPALDHQDLPIDKRRQLDMGVALRRHGSHLQELATALEQKRSLLITPLAPNWVATRVVDVPPDHEELRPTHGQL